MLLTGKHSLGKNFTFSYSGSLPAALACGGHHAHPEATGGRALAPHGLRHSVVPRRDGQRNVEQQPATVQDQKPTKMEGVEGPSGRFINLAEG